MHNIALKEAIFELPATSVRKRVFVFIHTHFHVLLKFRTRTRFETEAKGSRKWPIPLLSFTLQLRQAGKLRFLQHLLHTLVFARHI